MHNFGGPRGRRDPRFFVQFDKNVQMTKFLLTLTGRIVNIYVTIPRGENVHLHPHRRAAYGAGKEKEEFDE